MITVQSIFDDIVHITKPFLINIDVEDEWSLCPPPSYPLKVIPLELLIKSTDFQKGMITVLSIFDDIVHITKPFLIRKYNL